ncbi:hypothetical protein KQI65_10305 [bacterium]|nr:hypothetical protein [bacterium]
MKMLSVILALMFIMSGSARASTTGSTDVENGKNVKQKTVSVYYFHSTRRCKTCLSIERVARGVLKEKYGDNENVSFQSLNIEHEKNETLVEKYKIAGSSLIVCCGKEKVDLTAKAFQYALSSPEKLKDALIAAVGKMLK